MDEDGSIHVIEALLAGMIILTAVLFMAATTAPSPAEGQSGIDLAKVSADTLRVLQQRPPETDLVPNAETSSGLRAYPSRLDEIVDEAIKGHADAAANEALVRELVPAGNRYQLRIDNGVDHLILLPLGGGFTAQPRAAKAAETFVVPMWQDNGLTGAACAGKAVTENLGPYHPGGAAQLPFTVTGAATLTGPTGMSQLLAGTTWADWWVAEGVENGLPADRVPRAALYGWWIYNDGGAGGDQCFFVGLPDGTTSQYPSYGIQLVVWPIA